MRVFLTGIRSKFSRDLIPQLVQHRYDIVGVTRKPASYENLFNIEIVKSDMAVKIECQKKIDYIVHTAAYVPYNFDNIQDDFDDCYYNNIIATNKLLKFAVEKKVKRFIYISSVDVYGQPLKKIPATEEHPLNPQSNYAISKMCAEELCLVYCKRYGLQCVILRVTPVYGRYLSNKRFLSRLIQDLKSKWEVSIYNLEGQLSIIHTQDVADIIVKALDGPGGIYNIGPGQAVALKEFIHIACDILEKKDAVIKEIETAKSPFPYQFSIDKVRKYYGWEPRIFLEEGIQDMIKGV